MSTKKIMGIIAICAVVGIALFALVIYLTVKTKTKNISKHKPFTEWVGQTVVLRRETVLFEEKVNLNPGYTYTLMDSLHPSWQFFQDRKNLPENEVEEIEILPIGTEIHIDKAMQYTNGVSGFSTPTLLFSWKDNGGKIHKTGYPWGELDMSEKHPKSHYKYYRFHLAPWQDVPDTALYALPNADW